MIVVVFFVVFFTGGPILFYLKIFIDMFDTGSCLCTAIPK